MISVIIIGYNENWRLTKCLRSISDVVKGNKQLNFEVIYVDSGSTDDSVSRAKIFETIKIIEITGKKSAAIARNVGAIESKGDILLFLDGDMELDINFLNNALNLNGELEHDYITGHLDDYFYDVKNNFIDKSPRTYRGLIPKDPEELKMNGGVFMIKRGKWFELGGMRTNFRINEDYDFSLRFRLSGGKIIRLPCIMVKHHTVDYRNEERMWRNLLQGNGLYPPVILRNYFLNCDVLQKNLRSNYTSLLLGVALFSWLGSDTFIFFCAFSYFCILSMRVLLNTRRVMSKKNKLFYFTQRIFYQVLWDFMFLFGFAFFYPQKNEIKYVRIN